MSFKFKLLIFFCLIIGAYNLYVIESLKENIDFLNTRVEVLEDAIESNNVELETIKKSKKETASKPVSKSAVKSRPKSVDKPAAQTVYEKAAQSEQKCSAVKAEPVKIIKPSAKIRVENRYAERTYLPEGYFKEEGTVVVKVDVDWFGKVVETSIQSSTISDEDLQYACREAALRTKFSSNTHDGPDYRLTGTITYTFEAR